VAFLGTGCADSTSGLAGTAEETNEMAEGQGSVSSASENPSSSSESPNKAELSSSSLMVSPGVESSSNTVEQSSSGAENDSSPAHSGSTPVSGKDPNSFIVQYGIPDLHYDNSVLAATVVRNKTDTAPSTSEGDNNSSSLDFDKPGIYKLPDEKIEGMKTIQNKIEELKAGGTCSADGAEDYSAYVLVVAGDGRPNVLTAVSANSMTVTIVEMEGCSYSTEEKLYAFLFVYCSNVNLEAEIVKETKTIEKPSGKCIDLDFSTGWVNRQY
jgi:hypothetical protein